MLDVWEKVSGQGNVTCLTRSNLVNSKPIGERRGGEKRRGGEGERREGRRGRYKEKEGEEA